MQNDDGYLSELAFEEMRHKGTYARRMRLQAYRAKERADLLPADGEPLDHTRLLQGIDNRNAGWSEATKDRWWCAFADLDRVLNNPHLTDDERLTIYAAVWDIIDCVRTDDDSRPPFLIHPTEAIQ